MIYDVEESVGFLLAKAYQYVTILCKGEFAAYEITPPQFVLLAYLWRQDCLSQTELAKKSQIDPATISGIVNRLEKCGLVLRLPCPEDRRACRITLTVQGRALEEELIAAARRVRDKLLKRIPPNEYKSLGRILKMIVT